MDSGMGESEVIRFKEPHREKLAETTIIFSSLPSFKGLLSDYAADFKLDLAETIKNKVL